MALPTDDEYLVQLLHVYGDAHWGRSMGTTIASLPDRPDLLPEDLEVDRQVRDELADPSQAFRGMAIEALRRAALSRLGPDAGKVSAVPVGLIPTRELNACAVRTPRNGVVILLNNSVFWALPFLYVVYVALDSRNTDSPFSTALPAAAFGESIIGLAAFCATDDLRYAARMPARAVLRGREYDEHIVEQATMMEVFVLLHEYAHVLGGHLRPEHTLARPGPREPLLQYQREWAD